VRVFQPADGAETWQVMTHLATDRRPSYLRLCRQPLPEVHSTGYRFRFGVPQVVRDGSGVVVFAMGGTVPVAIEAADRLAAGGATGAGGAGPTVVNVSSLPVDRAAVARLVAPYRRVVVVEDHYLVGGLADELARIVLGLPERPTFDVLAVPDYGQAAPPEDLYRRYRLDAAGIAAHLREATS
jgi:transketolase